MVGTVPRYNRHVDILPKLIIWVGLSFYFLYDPGYTAGGYVDTPQKLIMSPNRRGGHIVFGADPVGVGVRVASFPCVIF